MSAMSFIRFIHRQTKPAQKQTNSSTVHLEPDGSWRGAASVLEKSRIKRCSPANTSTVLVKPPGSVESYVQHWAQRFLSSVTHAFKGHTPPSMESRTLTPATKNIRSELLGLISLKGNNKKPCDQQASMRRKWCTAVERHLGCMPCHVSCSYSLSWDQITGRK